MVLSIRTNTASLASKRHLGRTDTSTSHSLERLSTGLRINKAADDSSGLVISDRLRSQANGLGQAIRNANDAVSVVQVADAALEESLSILQTIKKKSIQSAQDGQTLESRKSIQSDISKLLQELDIIANTTSFNGQKLLSGAFTGKAFQIGAFSGEKIDLSISSSASTKIGHMTTSELTFEAQEEGIAYIGLKGGAASGYMEIPAVDLQYNNSPEYGLAALADNINELTQQTGIKAALSVISTSQIPIQAGTTDKEFSINQIPLGRFSVMENDADNSLVKSINLKTAHHGVTAAVDDSGRLILTSTDGRGIKVDPPPAEGNGTQTILGTQDLSTFGSLSIQGRGAGLVDVKNLGGGEPVAVSDTRLTLGDQAVMDRDSLLASGSILSATSEIGYPWTTDQVMTGSQFADDIAIESQTVLPEDTALGVGSVVLTKGGLPDVIEVTASGSTEAFSFITEGSILTTGSVLGAGTELPQGNIVSAGTRFKGDAQIASTLATTADSQVKVDSVLAAGTIIASGSVLQGTAVVETAGPLEGTATIRSGSTLVGGSYIASGTTLGGSATVAGIVGTGGVYTASAGSVIAAGSSFTSGTTLGGTAVVTQISDTASDYTLATNSTLTTGSIIASGTTLTGLAQIDPTGAISSNYNTTTGSRLTAGSQIASGTILSDAATINAVGPTSANWTLATGSVLRANSILGDGTTLTNTGVMAATTGSFTGATTVATGSTLAASTVFGDTSVVNGTAVINAIPATAGAGDDITLAAGSIIRAGSVLASGDSITTTSGVITAPAGATLSLGIDYTTTGVNNYSLETGSLAASTQLATGSVAGNPGFTLQAAMVPTANITLQAGSSLGAGTSLLSGSVIGAGAVQRLQSDMNFVNAGTLAANSSLAVNSIAGAATTIGADTITLAADLNTTGAMIVRTGSSFANASRLASGSVVGANGVTLSASMTLSGGAMTLTTHSTIELGSSLRQGTVIGTDGATLNADMTTTAGTMTIGAGANIAGGSSFNTNSIIGADGATLIADMAVGSSMTLNTGSIVDAGSSLVTDSVFPSDLLELTADMTLTGDMTLTTGSSMGQGSTIQYGSYIWADATLISSMTLRDSVTLASDMRLITDLTLGVGSRLGDNSILNQDSMIYLPLELLSVMEMSEPLVLESGSVIAAKKETILQADTEVGGRAVLSEDLVVLSDFDLKSGSILGQESVLNNDSTIGGMIKTAYSETVGEPGMSVGEGSVLAQGSLLAGGTFLTSEITGLNGEVFPRGTFLEEDTYIAENTLEEIMSLGAGSRIAQGSYLNMNSGENYTAARMDDQTLSTLSRIDVLSQEGAQQAIGIVDAAISDLDGIRADLGSVQNQLTSIIAGIAVAKINLYASASTIRDVDFTEEVQNLKKMEVLSEAGKFALSSSTERSQNLIDLLTQIDQR